MLLWQTFFFDMRPIFLLIICVITLTSCDYFTCFVQQYYGFDLYNDSETDFYCLIDFDTSDGDISVGSVCDELKNNSAIQCIGSNWFWKSFSDSLHLFLVYRDSIDYLPTDYEFRHLSSEYIRSISTKDIHSRMTLTEQQIFYELLVLHYPLSWLNDSDKTVVYYNYSGEPFDGNH